MKARSARTTDRNGVSIAVMSDDVPTLERLARSHEFDHKTGKVYGGAVRMQTRHEETGEVRNPLRMLDDLDRMEQKGQINQHQLAVARKFRAAFEVAQLDPLKAADLSRLPGGRASDLNARQYDARNYIARCVKAVGGSGTPVALALWWVVGDGLSHREAACRIGPWADHRHVAGFVIAALCLLAEPGC